MEIPTPEIIPQDRPADSLGSEKPERNGVGPALRCAAYALVLASVAVWVIFTNLGGKRLEGDEAYYALCVDHIRASGEWLTLSPHPPTAYFEKPPLYMWLTALTYDRVPGFEAKYRFWSAACGVGCVALTAVLGAVLLSPEVGLLASLLLLTNRQFLLEHGARQGDMDVALTLLMAACLLLYSKAGRDGAAGGHRRWGAWLLLGAVAGVACWFKPMAGLPMLALLAAHAIASAGRGRRAALVLPLLASVAVLVAVASPWYCVQWWRFGAAFSHELLGANLVKRVTVGLDPRHAEGPLYYLREITASSPPFALFAPALLFAAARAVRLRGAAGAAAERERRATGLLAAVGIGWLVLFSLSRSKFLHYAYPVFPVLALALAAAFSALVRGLMEKIADSKGTDFARAIAAAVWVGALFGMTIMCCRFAFSLLRRPGEKYMPWEIYRTFEPAIAEGSARLIFCGVPATPAEWGREGPILPSDMIYLSHMRGITRAATASDLEHLLAGRRPAVVLLSKEQDLQGAYDRLGLPQRFDDRFVYEYRDFTAAAVDTAALLRPRIGAASEGSSGNASSPYLQIVSGRADGTTGQAMSLPASFVGGFAIRVTPPLPEDCLLTVTFRRSPDVKEGAFSPAVSIDGRLLPDPWPLPLFASQRVSVFVRRDPQRPHTSRVVRINFQTPEGEPTRQSVTGTVTEAALTVQPRVPVEDESRLKQ